MTPAFLQARAILAPLEGVRNTDQGGDTVAGISRVFHPNEEPWPPSPERQDEILWQEYWQACACDSLPLALACALFDTAVNQGAAWAIRQLQATLRVTVDGVVGPATIAAAQTADPGEALAILLAHRAVWYATDPQDERLGLMARLFRLHTSILKEG